MNKTTNIIIGRFTEVADLSAADVVFTANGRREVRLGRNAWIGGQTTERAVVPLPAAYRPKTSAQDAVDAIRCWLTENPAVSRVTNIEIVHHVATHTVTPDYWRKAA